MKFDLTSLCQKILNFKIANSRREYKYIINNIDNFCYKKPILIIFLYKKIFVLLKIEVSAIFNIKLRYKLLY